MWPHMEIEGAHRRLPRTGSRAGLADGPGCRLKQAILSGAAGTLVVEACP
jgi:hypothetical protein